MKIYTKTGDEGNTSLFGGGTYPKNYIRIQAYGTVDELNASLGLALSLLPLLSPLKDILLKIQNELFILGSELASINPSLEFQNSFLKEENVERLEKEIDTLEEALPPLKSFILPGGCQESSILHLARTICRRAERDLVSLNKEETLRALPLQYLNRLSDLLFVMARTANLHKHQPDILWLGLK